MSMIEPVSEPVSKKPSSDEPQVAEMESDVPDLTSHSPQQPHFDFHPQKRIYTPPKADSNTFPSQKAFIDSLQTIPIDEVDELNRKCPICWKPFGEEPDLGFDNSELPVRLRCNHVFGNKCLAATFGNSSQITLKPLSFEAGSKGQLLGRKLHTYSLKNGADSMDRLKMFEKMLEDTMEPKKGAELFGKHWWQLIQDLQCGGRHTRDITFMENAMIVDLGPAPMKKFSYSPYAIPPQYLSPHSAGLNQTLSESAKPMDTTSLASSQAFDMFPVLGGTEKYPGYDAFIQASSSTSNTIDYSKFEDYMQGYEFTGSSQDSTPTWQEALESPTNLDKLAALQKEKMAIQKQNSCEKQTSPGKIAALDEALAYQSAVDRDALLRREAQERRKRNLQALLSRKLANVYAEYLENMSQADAGETAESGMRVTHITLRIHAHNFEDSSYEIESPMGVKFGEDDESDGEQDVDDMTNCTFVIGRSFCVTCCSDEIRNKALKTVTELHWFGHASSPDGCPVCHKVLFKSKRIHRYV
ncbi:hypothetical protein GQ44DRAFT_714546 [Phaeosphaeriaceae sp. PMI808]|nr:hypothetical protein GQ44DRAFT_714546 [Phaeosphaeriaceae sp. PMI808]